MLKLTGRPLVLAINLVAGLAIFLYVSLPLAKTNNVYSFAYSAFDSPHSTSIYA